MKLITNILTEVSDRSCDQLVHVLGTRNTFLRMWEMLKKLPVPATTLIAMKDFMEVSCFSVLLFELFRMLLQQQLRITYSSSQLRMRYWMQLAQNNCHVT